MEVVVTGTSWMGRGIGSIDSALKRLFEGAQYDMSLTVYSITGGADLLLDWMEAALGRGIHVRLVVNRLEDQSAPALARLTRLNAVFPHLHLYDFTSEEGDADLHAKLVVADRRTALIGSSNLSRRGLLNNHEMAVLLEGSTVTEVARAFDLLLSTGEVSRV